MKLEYDLVEDSYDDTTQIRTMTEQATVPNRGWLIRTTLYTAHQVTANVVFVPDTVAREGLFEPLVA